MSTKKKQGLILTLAIMLILAGIFQKEIGEWGNNILSNIFPPADTGMTSGPEETEEPDTTNEPEEPSDSALPAGADPYPTGTNEKVDYFSSERLARDASRGRMKDEYEKITKDSNATNTVKTQAYEMIMELARMSEAEKKIEMLIKEKGYEDCFACFSDSGEIDVIVKADSLTVDKVAQIADIISRHGSVSLDKIHLRSVK